MKVKPITATPCSSGVNVLPKILIVDDKPENLLALETILSGLKMEIIRAGSGEQALAKMLRHQFVVVLLDVKMPGMNGIETATLMQSHDRHMQTPVIFVTGYDMDELDLLEGYAAGAVDYVIKPINPDILLSKVRIFLQLFLQSQQLKRSNELLELSNSDLEDFAYVASHDLKAPLRAIDNLASWIEEDLDDVLVGEPRENMGLLRERVRRLDMLLEDLLQYSRAGVGEEPMERIQTTALIEDMIEWLDPPKNVAIVVDRDLPQLLTSKAALEQVFRNLIGNAIKHRGNITQGRIEITATDAGDWHQFKVSDNGPGIAPEFHERAFKMFQTLKPRDQFEGSGMGLALVKKIVNREGGSIWIESSGDSSGTTVCFQWRNTTERGKQLSGDQYGQCVVA